MPGSSEIAASSRYDPASAAPGGTTTSPRAISRQPTPARLSATRCPASARSTGSSCTCTERTRASSPRGRIRTWSPVPIDPDQSVPVTTVPIPRSVNERSTCSRAEPSLDARPVSPAATSSSAPSSSSIPVRFSAETGTIGVSGSSSATSSAASSGSPMSALVIATTPARTPSWRSTARCSRVCGITPSSDATQRRNMSTPDAPATIVRTKRSWPGTSTTESLRPDGSSSGA